MAGVVSAVSTNAAVTVERPWPPEAGNVTLVHSADSQSELTHSWSGTTTLTGQSTAKIRIT